MMPFWFIIISAYVMDIILGDPSWLPHPVRGIGWMVNHFESILRKTIKNKKIAGVILAAGIVGSVWTIVWFIIFAGSRINPYFGGLCSVFFIFTGLATRDLSVESMRVYRSLDKQDLDAARKQLSMIVGRDTAGLSRSEIIRATVETVAESTVDGIVAPLLYAFIGGAPLMLAYKAINTLDSMVGYRNAKYKYLGWASARLDDIANYIPARITALFLPLAAFLTGNNALSSFKIMWRDRKKHSSPNSAIPEAAAAGALCIQLGGANYYNGELSFKPYIGDSLRALKITDIKESVKMSYVCSLLVLMVGIILLILIWRG